MYSIAKARAIEQGPIQIQEIGAYALTTIQLMRLFGENGFTVHVNDNLANQNGPAWIRQVNQWIFLGWATKISGMIAFSVNQEKEGAGWMNPCNILVDFCKENECEPLMEE